MSKEIIQAIGEEIAKSWNQEPIFWDDFEDVANKIYNRIKPHLKHTNGGRDESQ